MRRIIIGYVSVAVPDDVYDWPANVEEIEEKMVELTELINSAATGETMSWPRRNSVIRSVARYK